MKKERLKILLQDKFFGGHKIPAVPRVLIFGLGAQGGGVGVARFFYFLGWEVVITDQKSRSELLPSLKKLPKGIRCTLGGHKKHDIDNAHLIVKNPGVPDSLPIIQYAYKKKISITNDGELFLLLAPRKKMIGITGTKGKTTTTLLLGHVLGRSARIVGTPGSSFFDYFFDRRTFQWIVAEFSSFDLEYTKISPHVALITSLFGDHLNRYRTFGAYAHAKFNILRFQEKGDSSYIYSPDVSRKYIPKTHAKKVFVPRRIISGIDWKIPETSASLVYRVAKDLGLSHATIVKRIKSFSMPHGRLETILKKVGRTIINDTTSTNPISASYSLKRIRKHFGKNITISAIVGGEDKNFIEQEIRDYADILNTHSHFIYLLPGSMSDRIRKYLKSVEKVPSLEKAVRRASENGGVIALLPGAASFNMFKNEFDRGEQFNVLARRFCKL